MPIIGPKHYTVVQSFKLSFLCQIMYKQEKETMDNIFFDILNYTFNVSRLKVLNWSENF